MFNVDVDAARIVAARARPRCGKGKNAEVVTRKDRRGGRQGLKCIPVGRRASW